MKQLNELPQKLTGFIGKLSISVIIAEAFIQWIISHFLDQIKIDSNLMKGTMFIVKFILEWSPIFIALFIVGRKFANQLFELQKEVEYQKKINAAIIIRYGWRTQKIIDASGKLYEDTAKENDLIRNQITKMSEGKLFNQNEIDKIIKESYYI